MSMRTFTDEQIAAMTFEEAEAELKNRVYEAAIFLEWLESAGLVSGNGHHAAQEIARAAAVLLRQACARS